MLEILILAGIVLILVGRAAILNFRLTIMRRSFATLMIALQKKQVDCHGLAEALLRIQQESGIEYSQTDWQAKDW